jgi:hypothetical protein
MGAPESFRPQVAEELLAQITGDLLGAAVLEDDAPVAIYEIDAYRETLQNGAVNFGVVNHWSVVITRLRGSPASGAGK